MAVTYKPLSDSDWQELGASDPGLASGDYKLQVGDLDNRSSLQFIDPKGHTLTQSQNDALVAVFQDALQVKIQGWNLILPFFDMIRKRVRLQENAILAVIRTKFVC